ncbi:MAG: iron export ABC transporter permease subunit FetB [Nitrospirales bacterium]|nr:MAG: iron export ABC transporter permease subunit FetB [Nitrospirales bacterium]
MNTSIQAVSFSGLLWAFVPACIVIVILYRWTVDGRTAVYALTRMLIQLLLIGYVLTYIFEAEHAGIIVCVMIVMLGTASWIALRPLKKKQPHLYRNALGAIAIGGVSTLVLVSQVVLEVQPWFFPRYVVPLAGMIFASSMNTVSLAAERFEAECEKACSYIEARNSALHSSLIPVINSLLAVGLVSLPGMMTGQILSGVSPLVATKYQIMVMCMIFGSSGISAVLYLTFAKVRTA